MLSTSSNETTKYAHSFEIGVGGKVEIVRYDVQGVTENKLYEEVARANPDFIIYIGTRWGPQPSIAALSKINAHVAPMVHLCSDAADPPWWDLLRDYDREGCFAVQVAIDGNDQWPGAERGLTLLTPVDPSNFDVRLRHQHRPINCGYGGNPGGERSARRMILWESASHNLLHFRMRDGAAETYADYCTYLLQCRMSLNIPHTGTETKMHVKGRVVESGLAGCCVLEVAGSPVSKWFKPDVEYLEFASVEQLRSYMRDLTPAETERRGDALRERVLAEHTPAIFWGKVLARIGMRKAA